MTCDELRRQLGLDDDGRVDTPACLRHLRECAPCAELHSDVLALVGDWERLVADPRPLPVPALPVTPTRAWMLVPVALVLILRGLGGEPDSVPSPVVPSTAVAPPWSHLGRPTSSGTFSTQVLHAGRPAGGTFSHHVLVGTTPAGVSRWSSDDENDAASIPGSGSGAVHSLRNGDSSGPCPND